MCSTSTPTRHSRSKPTNATSSVLRRQRELLRVDRILDVAKARARSRSIRYGFRPRTRRSRAVRDPDRLRRSGRKAGRVGGNSSAAARVGHSGRPGTCSRVTDEAAAQRFTSDIPLTKAAAGGGGIGMTSSARPMRASGRSSTQEEGTDVLLERYGLSRAFVVSRARRGAGHRRHAWKRRRARRARLHGTAAAPESARRNAFATHHEYRASCDVRRGDPLCSRCRVHERWHGRDDLLANGRGRRRLLFPRDELAPSGRTSGDRDGDGTRSRRAAISRRGWRGLRTALSPAFGSCDEARVCAEDRKRCFPSPARSRTPVSDRDASVRVDAAVGDARSCLRLRSARREDHRAWPTHRAIERMRAAIAGTRIDGVAMNADLPHLAHDDFLRVRHRLLSAARPGLSSRFGRRLRPTSYTGWLTNPRGECVWPP